MSKPLSPLFGLLVALLTLVPLQARAQEGVTLEPSTVPATGRQEAILTAERFGRFAVLAESDQGTALQGKAFLCALTAGGTEQAYAAAGYNHYTLRELLRPLEQTATLCGMRYLPPFALFGARTAREEGRVGRHAADWRRVLEALRDETLDLARAERLPRLNDDLDALLEESA